MDVLPPSGYHSVGSTGRPVIGISLLWWIHLSRYPPPEDGSSSNSRNVVFCLWNTGRWAKLKKVLWILTVIVEVSGSSLGRVTDHCVRVSKFHDFLGEWRICTFEYPWSLRSKFLRTHHSWESSRHYIISSAEGASLNKTGCWGEYLDLSAESNRRL